MGLCVNYKSRYTTGGFSGTGCRAKLKIRASDCPPACVMLSVLPFEYTYKLSRFS